MAQNNDPLFQSPKQFLKSSATEQPIRDASFGSGVEGEEPVLQTRPSYAEIASVQGMSPNAMRKAPSMGDFSDEKLLEMMKAPLTGEEVAAKIADLNANGVDIDATTISKEEFIAYDDWRRKQHFNFWGAVGDGAVQASKEIAGGLFSAATDWKKLGLAAAVGVVGTPIAGLAVAFGASAVEGFARGTRDLGGLAVMAANHPDSPLYRMFVNPTDDKDVAYEDFLDLSRWNSQSEKILAGKTNAFMPDRATYEKLFGKQFGDTIDDFVGVNKELATAASYVLDPTTFMTFGGGAAAKSVAAKAGAAALKSGQAGNAVGHAVAATASRNAAKATFLNSFGEMMIKTSNTLTKPVDAMFDAITGGMERLTGVKHNVSPVTGDVKAQRVHAGHGGERGPRSLTHALMGVGGVYSAFSIPYALPITSVYAGLKGLKYLGEGISDLATKGAKNADSVVGNAIRASSPIGIYMTDLAKTTIHGGIYGGAIGYATAGEEGAAGGIGTGIAIGSIGHNVGYAYGTLSGKFAKEALYKEFDEHMVNLKDKGDLLKQERVMKFINDIKEQHGQEEALRAISHVMGLEKSKNVTVSYMNYDDMVKALENDPNMTYWEETEVDVDVPQMEVKPDTLTPVDPNAPKQPQAPNPQTKQKKRVQKLTSMGEVLYQAVAAKRAGGQGWNGMFTNQNPITGKIETRPYALWKNGETGMYHVIINIDNVQSVRDAAGNVVVRYGPEKARPDVEVSDGVQYSFEPKPEERIDFDEEGNVIDPEETTQAETPAFESKWENRTDREGEIFAKDEEGNVEVEIRKTKLGQYQVWTHKGTQMQQAFKTEAEAKEYWKKKRDEIYNRPKKKDSSGGSWKPKTWTKDEWRNDSDARTMHITRLILANIGPTKDSLVSIMAGATDGILKTKWDMLSDKEKEKVARDVDQFNADYEEALKKENQAIKEQHAPLNERIQQISKEVEEATALDDNEAIRKLTEEVEEIEKRKKEIEKELRFSEYRRKVLLDAVSDAEWLLASSPSERAKFLKELEARTGGWPTRNTWDSRNIKDPKTPHEKLLRQQSEEVAREASETIVDILKSAGAMDKDGNVLPPKAPEPSTPKKKRTVTRETKKAKLKELNEEKGAIYEKEMTQVQSEQWDSYEKETKAFAQKEGLPEDTTFNDLTWKQQQEVIAQSEKNNPELKKRWDEANARYLEASKKIDKKIESVKALDETVGDPKLDAEIKAAEKETQELYAEREKLFDQFLRKVFNRGKPEDLRGIFKDNDPNLTQTMLPREMARAVELFEKTPQGKKLNERVAKAYDNLRRLEERASKKNMNRTAKPKTKKVPLVGPMPSESVTQMVQIAKTAPLGELWHVMNQVYREVNHQQTITNEVRNWLLTRAFTNRADTVKFMLETYDRIGGRARDMGAEGGRWMRAINEFEQTGKIEDPEVADSFNRFCEELGEAIFLGWEDGKPFDYIFRGGDLGFARGLLNDIADSFYNRALRDATNLGADIRTKDAFVDWFKKSRNSGVRIDPILADTFKDLVRFYNDKNMKNAGLNRTDLVRFSPAQIKDHARIYGYENRLLYGPNGEVTGLKPMLQYNQETHMAGKAMIQELAELATVDEAALNGLDFYIYNDKDDVDLAMSGTDGTLDTVGKSGQGFLFQSPDFKGMGIGLDEIVNAQIAKAKRDGIYAARDATSFGKRGRARTTPTGKMGEMMKEALAKGQHVVFRGIPTEKAFKIIEKYVPKAVADNVRLLAPIIADGGFSRPNVINGKYLGFTQAQRDGTILSREWGDEFSPRDVTFVPYDMQFKITLKDLKNPNEDYKRPHFRFNVRSVDIDALNRRGTILWNQSPELQKLYNGLHEFKADIFKTMDEYSGSGMIPATDFFGADDNARLKRKHVVAAIGASPNTKAQLLFSAAETEWHPYQKRDRGAEQNNPWFWMHMDGLHGLHTVDGEVMRMRMNEKGYYRAMIPTPTSEGAVGPNGVMMNQMYQNPDALTPSPRYETIAEEKESLERNIKRLDVDIAQRDKFGRRGGNPSYSWLKEQRRVAQNRLNEINRAQGGTMYQNPDEPRSVDRENEITQLRAKLLKINEVMAGVRGMQRYSPEATRMLQMKREFQAKLDFLEGKEGVVDESGSRQMYQTADEITDLNYDAFYGKGKGPMGKRNYFSKKENLTPALGGTRYDMTSEAWNTGHIGRWATQNGGRWQYAGKDGTTKKGDVIGHKTIFRIKKMSAGKGKHYFDIGLEFVDNFGDEYGSIGGELSEDGKTLKNLSVHAITEYQGNGYGNMMYSELLERLRALGVENFDGEIINPHGAPVGVRDTHFGRGNTFIMAKDWDTEIMVATPEEVKRRLERSIDLGSEAKGIRVRSRLNKSAFYQSPDAPIKLDIESMRRFNDETSDKPYDVNRVAEGMDDPMALLKKLNKLDIFKKSKLREDYSYAETYGAKDDQHASFLASNFKWAAEKGDVFQSDALRLFVQQTTGSKDIPVIRHTLEEFVSSTNAGVDAYNQSFKTGVPVAFVATQGTISPKLGGGDFRRDIKALKAHNHFNGQQATSYAYSYGGPQFANDANAFPEGNQIRAVVGMKNPLVYDFKGEYMRDDIVSTLVDKAKREKRDGIVMLNAIDPRISSNVKDNHYIVPKGNEAQIAVLDNSFGKSPVPRGIGGAEGAKMFQNPDDGVTLPKGIFGPNNPETVKIAREIMMSKGIGFAGIGFVELGEFIVRLNPEKSFKIGMEYDRMKHDPFNPLVRQAYQAFAKETLEQYRQVAHAGYQVEMHYGQEEPYANSQEAIKDIRENKRLRVLATDLNFGARTVTEADIKENPLLAMSEYKDVNGRQMRINDVFRFVHDFFGHSERGNGFGPIGEENAWDVHSRMYTDLARRAMTSGTRGQNSWVNFVNEANIEINRKRDLVRRLEAEGKIVEAAEIRKTIGQTRFADQKIGLMPEWTSKTNTELTPIERELYGMHQTVSGGFGLYQQPDGYEVNIHSPTVEQFSAIGKAAQAANKFGTSVEIKAPHDYEGYELLMAGDGLAQAAISPDGELGSVVRGPNGKAADVDAVIRAAIATGKVKWLNGFDTVLPSLYNNYGFEAVARLAFVDEYRPDGWDYNLYGKFNAGRPDVVFMALVGATPVPYARNGKHIPMVSSYDDAVRLTKERNAQAQNSGMMFQNDDVSILNDGEKMRLQTLQISLKYAEYMRMIDGKIKAGEFVASSRPLVLRKWLADNGPKDDNNKPLYTPINIGEKIKVGDKFVKMEEFSQADFDAAKEILFNLAEERQSYAGGVRLTDEQIAAKKRKARAMGIQRDKMERGMAWFRNLAPETREEIADDGPNETKRLKKAFKIKEEKEPKMVVKDEFDEGQYIEEETERLIDEEGLSPEEAKRIATEDAKQRAESIEYEVKNTPDTDINPIDEVRYYAEIASTEEVARMLRKADEARIGTVTYDVIGEKNIEFTQEDIKTDEEYMSMAEEAIKLAKETVRSYDVGKNKPQPKERSWRFGGETGDIEGTPPTVKLGDLYNKYRNSEYFDANLNPLQWRKEDGTIVKSKEAPAGAEPVYPPEIDEMRQETDRVIKEIKALDINGRGISAFVGLMHLWGFRINPNIADATFDPSYINFDNLMEKMGDRTEEEKMLAFITAEGAMLTQFEAPPEFVEVLKDFPELLDTTEEVISTIFRTYEFESGTFGEQKNANGKKQKARDAMRQKFVEAYYDAVSKEGGSPLGVTLDEMFYSSAEEFAGAKIRDKKKNYAKQKGIKVDDISHQEVKEMMREYEEQFAERNGKIMINSFFAAPVPLDKDGQPVKGFKDKTKSIERNIRERLRRQSDSAKKAKQLGLVLTEEQVKIEARKIVYKLQQEFVLFMFKEANRIYREQKKTNLKLMTVAERQEIRRRAMTGRDPVTGATGWNGLLEQNLRKIKSLEDATASKDEPVSTSERIEGAEDGPIAQTTKPKRGASQGGSSATTKPKSEPQKTPELSEMEAEVKRVEEAHRKAQAEAREKQGLPSVQPLEVPRTEPVTPQISQAVPPAPETSNATAKPKSRAEHEQREKMRKVMAEMTGEPFEPLPYEGPETETAVPVVEAKDTPNVEAYEDVDITEPAVEDTPPPPKKKKKVEIETKAEVETSRKDQAEANTVKPPEQVAVSVATVEQVGPIGARSVKHQQAVKDVLAIQDNLTLESVGDGNRKSVATKDKRYVVWKGVGNNNKALYVWMAAHEDIYRGTPLEKRRIAVVNSYEEAQLAIREFDNLMRVLAEREGLNTSQIVQASAPVMTPVQAKQTATQVAQQVKQNPTPPPATPTRKAHQHPEFSNAIIGLKMVIRMSNADAKKMVETAIDKLGEKATLTDIINQVLLDRQALAATVARANEQFAASVNAGAAANPDAVANVTITPSQIGLRNSTGAPRLPAGPLSSPLAEIVQPFNFNPSQGEIAAYKMLTTFRTHVVKYPVGNGGQAEGVMYVNPANYAIVQSGPSKWRLFNPAKALMSVWDNEQEACDAIFKHYFKR